METPGALALDKVLQQVSQDDSEEEWEYEYSATETEVYYLTLELSYPEFKDRPTKAPHHSRGGYYKNWTDQHADSPPIKATRFGRGQDEHGDNDDERDNGNEGEGDNENEIEIDDEPLPEPEADDDIDPTLRGPVPAPSNHREQQEQNGHGQENGKEAKRKEKGREEPDKEPENMEQEDAGEDMEEIQILDLHSPSPIISYRGKLFEGQWAEVIGTEAIFANREGDGAGSLLPALRRLPGGVDLLGASCSRILTTEKMPRPRIPVEDSLAAIRAEWNIRIPPGKDRTGERAQQIGFLENLMALKKKKGQADDVTVYAVDGAGKDFDDRKGPDFRPRQRRAATAGANTNTNTNTNTSQDRPGADEDDGGEQSGRSITRRRRLTGRNLVVSERVARRQRSGRAGPATRGVARGLGQTATASPATRPSTMSRPTPSQADEDDDNDSDRDSRGSMSEDSADDEDETMEG